MKFNRILDYIIEQSNRDDAKSLEFEQDILFNINRLRTTMTQRVISSSAGFTTLLEMQHLLNKLEQHVTDFNNRVMRILLNKFSEYYNMAYYNTEKLIGVGQDIERKHSKIKEQISVNDKMVDFIQNHAFELIKGYNNNIISRLRADFGNLLLSGTATKENVRNIIEKVLDISPMKASEYAQNELSRAYNYGVIAMLKEFARVNGVHVRKYWHGFQYSPNTCAYCNDHIGEIYELDDESEILPAHSHCRCVWLPILDGWEGEIPDNISKLIGTQAGTYPIDLVYDNLNMRLGVNYSNLIPEEDAIAYLTGSRAPSTMSAIANARIAAISNVKSSINIQTDKSNTELGKMFNIQFIFWRDIIAAAIVDNDNTIIDSAIRNIDALMTLPWNDEQMAKWVNLIEIMNKS